MTAAEPTADRACSHGVRCRTGVRDQLQPNARIRAARGLQTGRPVVTPIVPRSRALLPSKSAAALAVAFAATVIIGILAYRAIDARSSTADAVNHTVEVRAQLDLLGSEIKDAETGQRGFLLTGNEHYLEPYERAVRDLPVELARFKRLTLDNPDQQERSAKLEPMVAAKLAELGATIAFERGGDHAAALAMVRTDRGKLAMDQIRAVLDAMLAAEQQALSTHTAVGERAVQSSSFTMIGGAAVLLFVLIIVGLLASRDFRTVESESWVRRLQVALNREVQGDLRLGPLGDKVLAILAVNLRAQVGAIYVTEPGGQLTRIAGHALADDAPATLAPGVGLTAQAVKDRRIVHLRDVPDGYLRVGSAVGGSRAREVTIVPAVVDGVVQAVIELGYFHALDAAELLALERAGEAIATAVRTSRDRTQLEALLGETQRQAEELQAQQEEIRVTNEELEQQSRALQVSQVQLENQQAEVEQINAQLEEQAQSLAGQRDDLARAGAELQRSNEYKSQFLANMSHELRTPLNSSLILAKLLADNRDGNLNAEQIKFAQTIYGAGNDLLVLINDILDLSKIEAGMLDVRAEPIGMGRLIDDLNGTFQPVATQRQLALATSRGPNVPDTIESDPTRLRQILKNLLSNALKFTERGGVTLEITRVDDRVHFAVRDTGIGIDPGQLELIFQPFRQADGAINRKFGGTGLGLSISRDLARLLGGELTVASSPGHGATFTLAIPIILRVGDAPAAVVVVPSAEPRPQAAPSHAGAFADDRDGLAPGARTLLVIEDDPAFARVLYDLAHELDFRVLVADTADDGIALARRFQPSAIVLDVGLPDRSGLAVLDALKRDAKTRHVPVHMVSGSDHTRTALELGAVGYALKPIARDELIDAIHQLEARFTQRLRRVLIVEDDPVLRDSTARLLGGEDVETVTAGTTAAALELLRTTTFDCMVLDLALPDRSGLELLEEMARGEQYSFPPVIVYTGRSLSHDQIHELERFSRSIIIKGARSPERLLDEVTLFLHQVESKLPIERQRMLRDARDREATFEGKRILVVEDDVRNVFALTSVLEPKGAKVEIARNGKDALAHLAAKPGVDLVLMDIMMPEMDGLEATRRIRAQPALANLPIIALTAKAMADDRDRCLEAGANDYIAKPLDVDRLVSLARIWVRK